MMAAKANLSDVKKRLLNEMLKTTPMVPRGGQKKLSGRGVAGCFGLCTYVKQCKAGDATTAAAVKKPAGAVSFSMTMTFEPLTGVVARNDTDGPSVQVSADSKTVFVRMRVGQPTLLKQGANSITLPTSPITGNVIRWAAINEGDVRYIFTDDKDAELCFGEITGMMGLTCCYTAKEMAPNTSKPLPPSKPAPPASVSTTTPFLGFDYTPTPYCHKFMLGTEELAAYYSGAMPIEVARCLEIEHPDIVWTPLVDAATSKAMVPTLRWSCEKVLPAVAGDLLVDVSLLRQQADDLENVWFVIDALDRCGGNVDNALADITGHKIRIVHRPSPPDDVNDVDASKVMTPGPGTIQKVTFGMLHKAPSGYNDKKYSPWYVAASSDGGGAGKKGGPPRPRLAGTIECTCWGPGEDYFTVEKRSLTIWIDTYEKQIKDAYGIVDPTVWEHLGPLFTSRGIVVIDCLPNPMRTRDIDSNAGAWSTVQNAFTLDTTVIRMSANIRPAVESLEQITLERASDILEKWKLHAVRPAFIDRIRHDGSAQNYANLSIFYAGAGVGQDIELEKAAAVDCEFRLFIAHNAETNAPIEYIIALRPAAAAAAAATSADAAPSSALPIDARKELRCAIRASITQHGGFYHPDGKPLIVDDTNIDELAAQRGVAIPGDDVGQPPAAKVVKNGE